jgi:hypothetical protein
MDRINPRVWILMLVVAASTGGCGIKRYAQYEYTGIGDPIFVEGPVRARLDTSWYKGATDFDLAVDAGGQPVPHVSDVAVEVDWVAPGGRGSFPRQRCEAARLSCEIPAPKNGPDDMLVEISFTLTDPGGPPRRITRRRTLHREWHRYFWILRDC